MARKPRFKPYGDDIYYHLYSRTVGQEFFLGKDYQKDIFLEFFRRYSSIFFVKPIAFCVMDNHFHIIVKSVPSMDYTDDEIQDRIKMLINKKFNKIKLGRGRKGNIKIEKNQNSELIKSDTTCKIKPEDYENYLHRLGDISEYVKRIKESYAMWYNRIHERTGTLWGDRFKNVILEPGRSLLMCSSYIELNPVRAKMTERPDNYQWNSLYARQHKTNISKILSFVGIYDEASIGSDKALEWYRKYVFITGGSQRKIGQGHITREIIEIEEKTGYSIKAANILMHRIPHFTGGSAIGSQPHISKVYKDIESLGLKDKRDRKAYAVSSLGGLFSLRRLKSVRYS